MRNPLEPDLIEDDPYYKRLRRQRASHFNGDEFIRIGIFSLSLLVALFFGCCRGYMVSRADAMQAADFAGFTEAEIISESRIFPSLAGCSNSDAAGFLFRAKNAQAKRVQILVCVGWPFKGSTVRIP